MGCWYFQAFFGLSGGGDIPDWLIALPFKPFKTGALPFLFRGGSCLGENQENGQVYCRMKGLGKSGGGYQSS